MKKYYYLIGLILLFSCNQKKESEGTNESSMTILNDTIPTVRKVVSKAAVASYSEVVKDMDNLNDWKFAVDVFETAETFKYKVKIKYKELDADDDLTLPNFGIQPQVKLEKGEEELSCIIGFLDKDGAFMEFKRVEVIQNQLKIKQTKGYGRSVVRAK
jgi:hypothetical protein